MSNKRSIEWHESCLKNSDTYIKAELEIIASRQADISIVISRNNFLRKQIEEAKRKKMDGFDCDRFMKPRPTNEQGKEAKK
jgi:hypothetical protein